MKSLIDTLSHRIAVRIKESNPEETSSVEVMTYALQGIFQNVVTVGSALLIGLCFGHFLDTFLAATCFMGLRLVSGGFHFKSAFACFVFSASVFAVIPFIEVDKSVIVLINVISLFLAAIFSPSNIKEHIRVEEKYFPLFKLVSVILVAANFFILSSIVAFAFLAQTLSLITLKKEVRS